MLRLLNIGWYTKEDGPGNRVVIFLQGCHLRCPWCHSPHSWDLKSSPLLFHSERCTLCGLCVKVCPQGVHRIEQGKHIIDRSKCSQCGKCIAICPNSIINSMDGALSLPTIQITVEELYEKVKPQLEMFKENGGVTLSGGEALLQKDEVRKFLLLCKKDGISTCIESSFTRPTTAYESVKDYVDYWLAGLRDVSFGQGNLDNSKNIIRNIKTVSKHCKKIYARYPLIAARTTEDEHLIRFASIMKQTGITDVEILRCNPNMNLFYKLAGIPSQLDQESSIPTDMQFKKACDFFKSQNFTVNY
jgi:glycyl-radical enzyme activating protein family